MNTGVENQSKIGHSKSIRTSINEESKLIKSNLSKTNTFTEKSHITEKISKKMSLNCIVNEDFSEESIEESKMIDFRVHTKESDVEIPSEDDNITESIIGTHRSETILESLPQTSIGISLIKESIAKDSLKFVPKEKVKKVPSFVKKYHNIPNSEVSLDPRKQPKYDISTEKKRFIQQKVNKLANKMYNQEVAEDYRNLKSEYNLKLLNDIKSKLTQNEHKYKSEHKDCGFCKSYK